ncbi:S8 family serine peptidase [Leptolyngbya sp. 7M]|uniref:S8 family serine peptidase n=1 Tax=Leptolyngbya sp. 7M TaxID=2812896 RepID=UPI001B8CCAF5|nr:S8 family serine peptidase [Leptolyngbya sp. 7M]QYO67471.1 S8 family serine peptidase [Leptolyngbya sp. 7M]
MTKLTPLMKLTSGRPEVVVGLIDGAVLQTHGELAESNIREISGGRNSQCVQASSAACIHGTFVAGILCGKRTSLAPAICSNCTLLVRPIFAETTLGNEQMPSASPTDLATAIIESVDAGARVLNMSVAIAQPSLQGERELQEALDYALQRGVIAVAASGNQGTLGSSAITRHPWVIPVVACDLKGKPIHYSNLGNSIGRRGLSAPGDQITSLGTQDKTLTLSGTSFAVPFVTGAIALLWSEFPTAAAAEIKLAVTQSNGLRRATVVPPLLDAWAAYQVMAKSSSCGKKS